MCSIALFDSKKEFLDFIENGSIEKLNEKVKEVLDHYRIKRANYSWASPEVEPVNNLDREELEESFTVVEWAIEEKNYNLAMGLIERGYEYDKDYIVKNGNLEIIQKVFGNLEEYSLFKVVTDNVPKLLDCINQDYIREHINDYDLEKGITPLMLAIKMGNMELAKIFIEKYGADIKLLDKKEEQDGLYHYLSSYKNLEDIKKLVNYGGNPLAPKTTERLIKRFIEVNRDSISILEWLTFFIDNKVPFEVSKYTNISRQIFEITHCSHIKVIRQILDLLIENANNIEKQLQYIFNQLCHYYPQYNSVLYYGGDLHSIYNEYLSDIIAKWYKVDSVDEIGNTALFYCRSVSGVKFLLSLGIDKTIKNKLGKTAVEHFKELPTNAYSFSEAIRNDILKIIDEDRKPNEINLKVYGLTSEQIAKILKEKGYEVDI